MSEEDDWFERALRETDEEPDERPGSGESEADGADGGESDSEEPDGSAVVGPDEGDGDESVPGDPATEIGLGSGDADDGGEFGDAAAGAPDGLGDADSASDDPFGGDAESADDDPFGGDVGTDSGSGDQANGGVPADAFGDLDADDGEFGSLGGDDPFGGGDAGAGGGADAASAESRGSSESDGADQFGEDDPFGGSRGGGESASGSGGAAGGSSGGGGDPFGGYRGSAGGGDDDFGFGEFGGGGAEGGGADFDVDPDEFESAIARTDVGIKGLDDMILGGVPSRSLLSVIGGAGTGKTTFALQFLNHALESGEKGIYITLEQTRESIYDTADEKGWSFREHAAEDRLAVVAIDPIEMANSLSSIRNDLVRLIAEFDADRLVLDSVSLLEMMYDHPAKRRSEVFGFTRSLKEAGVTTLLTSEASEETKYASRHGIVEYLTDAVFVLQYVRGSDFRETRLAVEIQKIRDANHSRETKPYDITDTGISVYDQANIF